MDDVGNGYFVHRCFLYIKKKIYISACFQFSLRTTLGYFHVVLPIEFKMSNKYCPGINMTATLSQAHKSLFYFTSLTEILTLGPRIVSYGTLNYIKETLS